MHGCSLGFPELMSSFVAALVARFGHRKLIKDQLLARQA
jgi:hypothetical protein